MQFNCHVVHKLKNQSSCRRRLPESRNVAVGCYHLNVYAWQSAFQTRSVLNPLFSRASSIYSTRCQDTLEITALVTVVDTAAVRASWITAITLSMLWITVTGDLATSVISVLFLKTNLLAKCCDLFLWGSLRFFIWCLVHCTSDLSVFGMLLTWFQNG